MNNNRKNNGFSHNVLFYSVIFLCIMGIAYFLFGEIVPPVRVKTYRKANLFPH